MCQERTPQPCACASLHVDGIAKSNPLQQMPTSDMNEEDLNGSSLKSQQAIISDEKGELKLCCDVPVPDLEPDRVMVKIIAVAINPVDIKMQGRNATTGAVAGHDFAGIVVAIGSESWTAAPIAVGDRVCGAVVVSYNLFTYLGE